MSEPLISMEMLFGHLEVESRIRWTPGVGIGEVRTISVDAHGILTVGEWVPTGVELHYVRA